MTALYARTGLMEEIRPKDGDPAVLPASAGDLATATALFSAVMTGLFHRERTGEGSRASTSLMSNGLWINSSMLQSTLAGAAPIKKFHRTEWPNPVTAGTYRTSDDRYIIIVELNPANFENCLDALGADHLKGDERFTTPELRYRNHQLLFDEIQKIIGLHKLASIADILRKGSVNFSVTQTTEECTRDEHMIANGCFPEVEGSGGIRTVDSPITIQADGIDKVTPKNPPTIGEHTMSELTALGYSEEDVNRMAEARAVGLPVGVAE
jgi:formyl-CoA transferase